MTRSLNIVLFGQTGAGKSSVINMIAGSQVARISDGAAGCTLSFESYSFPVGDRTIHIWDTIGLDEPEMEIAAIGQACDLIIHLRNEGVDLLLFCIRAPRITATSQANYRLFYEALCRSRVPIALVITHLERETDMERWWKRNVERLEKLGLKAASHACVTCLPRHSHYPESQQKIAELLNGYDSAGRFKMPANSPESWLVETLRLFGRFVKRESRRKDMIEVLVERCRIDPEAAEEIARKLEHEARAFGLSPRR